MSGKRIDRAGHLRWVAVADVHTNPLAQRDLREGWAAQLAQDFDPDYFTPPLLSLRDGKYWIIDGQHRFAAMHLMGWDDQQVQCWVYEGLTEADEAFMFLRHNDRRNVSAFDRFRIAITAGLPDETDIDRIVRALGLHISYERAGISCVGALAAVYALGDSVLTRSLRVIRDAYGDAGYRAEIVRGFGMLFARFGPMIDDARLVDRLRSAHGGMFGVLTAANASRRATGRPLPHCIAAAVVELLNRGRGGSKLPSWWSDE